VPAIHLLIFALYMRVYVLFVLFFFAYLSYFHFLFSFFFVPLPTSDLPEYGPAPFPGRRS